MRPPDINRTMRMDRMDYPDPAAHRDFIGYEYTSVRASVTHESMVVDGYRNFGWQLDGVRRGVLTFKRDRNLLNKTELTRLQRQFDAHLRELDMLEHDPAHRSSFIACAIGLIGCALLGGATFAYLDGLVTLMIVLAVPGFLCWIVAYPIRRRLRHWFQMRSEPAIEHLLDVNYDVCRRASALLVASEAPEVQE